MSDQAKLGKLCSPNDARDAVHVAVVPMVADKKMRPGETVSVNGKSVGVVDPFLADDVKNWLCLYPGSITSLRHDWTHPAFEIERADEVAAANPLNEKAAMLATVLSNPNDEQARLVFADWCDEHGDAGHAG